MRKHGIEISAILTFMQTTKPLSSGKGRCWKGREERIMLTLSATARSELERCVFPRVFSFFRVYFFSVLLPARRWDSRVFYRLNCSVQLSLLK
mmetsp:Transcript_481/g.915  ORF Transcript_481/g.915 Transcript_481/m.915 type:complete len:93 (-) Transcript_481:643-921(-)